MLWSRITFNSVIMRLLRRYSIGCVVGVALLFSGCEKGAMLDSDFPSTPGNGDTSPGFGVKPTVPLKRRPIVPKDKLKRPNIIERINWTAAGTLSVTIAEDTPAVVTIVEYDGTMHDYVSDAQGVEITDVPEEAFELRIETSDVTYAVLVE